VRYRANARVAKLAGSKSIEVSNDKISPALTDAIAKGNLLLCQQLIQRGFSIDGTCECGCTALLKACVHFRKEVAVYLLGIGAPADGVVCSQERSASGLSMLHFAASYGDQEFLENVFKREPAVSEEGLQPIHLAARGGLVSALRFLLERAKDPKSLLEARTNQSPPRSNGRAPYQHMKLGDDIKRGSPLHFATKFGHVEAVEFLLRAGANLEARDEQGLTALQFAIMAPEFKDLFGVLIAAGANLNTRDNGGANLLMRAGRGYQLKPIEYLISMSNNGLDLRARDNYGNTALHYAIKIGSLEVAKRLVQAGLDSADPEYSGGCPIQLALHLKMDPFPLQNLPEVDTIRSKAHGSILNTAIFCGHEEVVAELLKRVPETDAQEYVNLSCDIGTPLYCAASRGSVSMIEKLLEKGAQVNLVRGQFGSPLMAACAMGQVEAVILLLRNGAELECVQPDGTLVKAEEAAQQHETVLSILRQFKERGVEALGEVASVKTADISKLDEFMIGFKEGKEKGLGESSVRPTCLRQSPPKPRDTH
jgi:ankyrin repeat protein